MEDEKDSAISEKYAMLETVDTNAYKKAYRKLMKKSVQTMYSLFAEDVSSSTTKWTYVQPTMDGDERVCLWTKEADNGYYIVQARAILNADAWKVFALQHDNNWETRKRWDTQVMNTEVLGTFTYPSNDTSIDIVQSFIPMPLGFQTRHCLGIQWKNENPKKGISQLIFKTTECFMASCPPDMVSIDALTGIIVTNVPGKKKDQPMCEIKMITHVNPGGSVIPSMYNMFIGKARERILLYEQIANEWESYYPER